MSIPIISFYSYKGGSGRTTTAANVVGHLADKLGASPESPLLLIDYDTESAGMTYFFNLHKKFYSATYPQKNGGLVSNLRTIHTMKLLGNEDFLKGPEASQVFQHVDDIVTIEREQLELYESVGKEFGFDIYDLVDLEVDSSLISMFFDICRVYINERERFVKDDRFDLKRFFAGLYSLKNNHRAKLDFFEMQLPTVGFIDISTWYGRETGSIKFLGIDDTLTIDLNIRKGESAIDYLFEKCEEANYCGIVCDSSSGRQRSAHILHRKSDIIIYCMRPTYQFRIGTEKNIALYSEDIRFPHIRGIKTKILLLPTAVPEKPYTMTEQIFNEIKSIVQVNRDIIIDDFCDYDNALGEVNRFKWCEGILNEDDLSEKDEVKAFNTYIKIAEVIYNNLKGSDR